MDDSHCPFAVGELFYAGDDLLVGRVGEMDSPFRFVEQFFDMGQVGVVVDGMRHELLLELDNCSFHPFRHVSDLVFGCAFHIMRYTVPDESQVIRLEDFHAVGHEPFSGTLLYIYDFKFFVNMPGEGELIIVVMSGYYRSPCVYCQLLMH